MDIVLPYKKKYRIEAVSYTHLDVYKRQYILFGLCFSDYTIIFAIKKYQKRTFRYFSVSLKILMNSKAIAIMDLNSNKQQQAWLHPSPLKTM